MKAKTLLAAIAAAICWISLCIDQDILMYLSGFMAMLIIGHDDLKNHFRAVKKMFRKFGAGRSIRKEVVKA